MANIVVKVKYGILKAYFKLTKSSIKIKRTAGWIDVVSFRNAIIRLSTEDYEFSTSPFLTVVKKLKEKNLIVVEKRIYTTDQLEPLLRNIQRKIKHNDT